MIRDARVLRSEFVPREVVHRDQELNHLASVLEPISYGEPAESALLTGPSGAGKTCLARFVTDQLQQETLDATVQYVNCWQAHSQFRTVYHILEGLGKTLNIHRQSTPHDELIERLREYNGPHCVVILDEVDQLEDKRILYDLYALPQFSTMLIANREEELFADLDERIISRYRGCDRVRFDKYGVEDLTAILHARAERGLRKGAVDQTVLATIADAAAGDARLAISVLRSAARTAMHEQSERITEKIVEEAIPHAQSEMHRKNLDTLTHHQRALYEVIQEEGEIAPSDLYTSYRKRVESPKSDRTVRTYLSKMDRYGLIAAEGTSRDRLYRISNSFDQDYI
ncbi:Cdc6/Cdc18 family protein [Natronorarus salvus]|uniref:Cdc6/Cdc18 family protein n=1 Tax=Natronorarus salvus TaxID=3117733 RepID=UPI002F266C31